MNGEIGSVEFWISLNNKRNKQKHGEGGVNSTRVDWDDL